MIETLNALLGALLVSFIHVSDKSPFSVTSASVDNSGSVMGTGAKHVDDVVVKTLSSRTPNKISAGKSQAGFHGGR